MEKYASQSRWIKVPETLPPVDAEFNGESIIVLTYSEIGMTMGCYMFESNTWVKASNVTHILQVTHYQIITPPENE